MVAAEVIAVDNATIIDIQIKPTFTITIEKRRGSFKINTTERILWSYLSVHYDN